MIYKTYKIGPINLHTIKCNKFRQCHMEIIFRNNIKKEELTLRSFLFEMLTENNKKYSTRRELVLKLEELYNAYIYSVTSRVGNTVLTSLCLDFINSKYTKGEFLSDVLSLPFELINNPNVENNEFDINTFNIIKKRLELDILSINEDPKRKSIVECLKETAPNTASSYLINGTLDDLNRITPLNLYEYYKNVLNHDIIDVYIIGDLNMDEVSNIIKDLSTFNILKEKETEFLVGNKPSKKIKEKRGMMNVSQANVAITLNINNPSEFERNYVARVYNGILGAGSLETKLYKYLRNENSLCYNVGSSYQKYDELFIIQTAINKENYKTAIKLIKKALKEMTVGNFTEDDINNTKETLYSSLDSSYETPGRIVDNYLFQNITDLDPLEERYEKYKSVTKKDIINFAKKVSINTIYMLSDGDQSE